MNEDIVTYEQAVKLKELGFNWETHAWYNTHAELWTKCPQAYPAPTLAQASKWLRDKYNLFVHVYLHLDDCWRYEVQCIFNHENYMYEPEAGLWWRPYEQALSAGIDQVLELITQQNNGDKS